MTLMIALVGEQTLPNMLPVRHYHPEGLLLIYTQRTKPVYDRLQAFLKQETSIYGLETNAYEIVTIMTDINNKLEKSGFVKEPLLFNLESVKSFV